MSQQVFSFLSNPSLGLSMQLASKHFVDLQILCVDMYILMRKYN